MSLRGTASACSRDFMVTRLKMGACAMRKKASVRVLPQQGHLRPGMFAVGGDSHSPTGGAFGAYMFGIGSTEMLGVVTTGEIWLRVPQTIFMRWSGRLARGVSAKDMMLSMIGRYGMNGGGYQAVEYCGLAVQACWACRCPSC